jgi:hypothetical protein
VLSAEVSDKVSVAGVTALARGCHGLETVNPVRSCPLIECNASLLEEQFEP